MRQWLISTMPMLRQPVHTGSQPAIPDHTNHFNTKLEITMKSLTTLFSSLILSLVLAGSALAGETVNINTADAATIDRVLVNVGPTKAQAIVDHRKANGAFRSPEQLALVKGIGLKTVEKNRDRIMIGPVHPAANVAKPAVRVATAPKPVARR
jgi:competence protein ComEA